MQINLKIYKQAKRTSDRDGKPKIKSGIVFEDTFSKLPSKPAYKNVCFSIFFIDIAVFIISNECVLLKY